MSFFKTAWVGIAILCSISVAADAGLVESLLKGPRKVRAFKCDNTIYMSSHPYDQYTTDLSTINPLTSTASPISSTSQYGYDAIGFNHLDGYLYGISNYFPEGGQPHVIRLDPSNGQITDLGTLPQLAGKEWIVGTIMKDGTYVIGDFGTSSWLSIDLTGPKVIDQGQIPVSLVTAWAANPLDNVIYGYQSYAQRLMSFNPATGEFKSFDKQLLNVGVQPCSNAFYQDGTMYLYCKTSDASIDRMFQVDLSAQVATEVSEGKALGAGDMATCAFKTETPPTPPDDIPGSWQDGKECIEISADGKTAKTYRNCAPFIKCGYQEGVITYDSNGKAVINYESSGDEQVLNLLSPRRLEVIETSGPHRDTGIYKKVERCRWKPHFPFPPHPHPTPTPPPTPKPAVVTLKS